VRFVEARGWLVPEDFEQTARLAAPVTGLAQAALDKAWKKARKRARDIEQLDAEHRHELRKQLKELRYAVEFLAPLYQEKRIEPFLKRLKKLQDVFGELNDAATVKLMFSGDDAPLAKEASAQRAIGWLIGAAQARAEHGWDGAKALWKDLEDTRPFWQ
jgi:CHAD domain-containing protein